MLPGIWEHDWYYVIVVAKFIYEFVYEVSENGTKNIAILPK